MRRKNRKSPFLPPPNDIEIQAFLKYQAGGPTKSEFRVDVRGTNQRSPWNCRCAEIFAAEYVQTPEALTNDTDVVEEVFMTHIQALCLQYAKLDRESNPDDSWNDTNTLENLRRNRQARVSTIQRQHYETGLNMLASWVRGVTTSWSPTPLWR